MKKLVSIVLALAMILMVSAAFADTLTVSNIVTEHDYYAYQIFTGTKAANSANLGDVAFGTGITSAGQTALFTYYELDADTNTVQELVDAIADYSGTETQKAQHFAAFFDNTDYLGTGTKGTINGTNAVWSLTSGYYFVKDYYVGDGTQEGRDYSLARAMVQVVGNTSIQNKADKPTLTKDADDHSVEVGQDVTFTLNSSVPDTQEYTKYEMTFTDYMTDGLTLESLDNFVVRINNVPLTKGTDYTLVADTKTFGTGDDAVTRNGFKLVINMLKTEGENKVAKYTYKQPITITYKAKVNENAISVVSENYAELEFNNNPGNSESTGKTPPDTEKVFSAKVNILKVDADQKDEDGNYTKPLEGAKFVLKCTSITDDRESDKVGKFYYYDATNDDVQWITVASENQTPGALLTNSAITIATTNTDGEAFDVFKGLENGTYDLIEIQAPLGYNLLASPSSVTIAGSDSDLTTLTVAATVENNQGTQLPSTGGIGTTIFYILGGLLVVGAAVILVARRKAQD